MVHHLKRASSILLESDNVGMKSVRFGWFFADFRTEPTKSFFENFKPTPTD